MGISIIIGSKEEIICYGIRGIIEQFASDKVRIIGEANSNQDVLRMAKAKPADMYLLGFHSHRSGGIKSVLQLKEFSPFAKIILLSFMWDKDLAEKALWNGADGYVLWNSSSRELIDAIYLVSKGKCFVSPNPLESEDHIQNKEENNQELLTRRQEEILQYICEALSEKEIAKRLNISKNTVHVHKTNIMQRLNIHSTTGLLRYGFRTADNTFTLHPAILNFITKDYGEIHQLINITIMKGATYGCI